MSDSTIAYFNVEGANWEPLEEFGGAQAILYKSDDGRRLAGSFKESGTHQMVMPYDEFVYVLAGSVEVRVAGGETIRAAAGDAFYVKEGMDVTWAMSDDFHDVTVLISDTPIDY